ncbi:MAG: HPr family phosphocarrier protein [Clostridia bacterium]
MVTKTVTITNQVGLHTRPATFFIQKANSFKCSVLIEKNERRANAKSLLGVLSLGISMDDVVSIITDGVDEQEAADGLVDLLMNI